MIDPAATPSDAGRWFRLVVEGIPDLITIHDAGGRRLYTSPAAAGVTGYTEEELNALPLGAITHPDDQTAVAEANRRVAETGEPVEFSARIRHKDGSTRHLEISFRFTAVDDAGLPLRIAVARDVTERVNRERDLRSLAERLEVMHAIDGAILRADSVHALAQATLSRLRDMIPCERASMVEFLPESDQARVFALSANGHIGPDEDEVFPLSDFSAVRSDREHLRSVEDLATVADPSPMMRRVLERGGRSGLSAWLVVGDEVLGELNLTATAPRAFSPLHLSMLGEVADQLAIALHQSRLREKLAGYTEELEDRVHERTAELAEVAAELNSFAYSVSHDLRAPLRAMQGFSQALIEDYGSTLDATAKDYAQRIDGAAGRMDGLIQDMLTYSRVSRRHLELEPVSLSSAVAAATSQLESDISRTNAVIRSETPFPDVLAHQVTLVQILSNLLSNAVKFVAPGTEARVDVRTEEREGLVRVWIEDNGIGINQDQAERVFQMFERLHGIEEYPGTGIGLAIVRRAVERMGGRVGVEPRDDGGSRFWFELAKAA